MITMSTGYLIYSAITLPKFIKYSNNNIQSENIFYKASMSTYIPYAFLIFIFYIIYSLPIRFMLIQQLFNLFHSHCLSFIKIKFLYDWLRSYNHTFLLFITSIIHVFQLIFLKFNKNGI